MKCLIPLLVITVLELTSLDGVTFYFPVGSIGPFRAGVGCQGTTIYTADGTFCVRNTPEDIAKKLRNAEQDDKEK